VFQDRSRLAVLLLDGNEHPAIVKCKQGAPTVADLRRLRPRKRSM